MRSEKDGLIRPRRVSNTKETRFVTPENKWRHHVFPSAANSSRYFGRKRRARKTKYETHAITEKRVYTIMESTRAIVWRV